MTTARLLTGRPLVELDDDGLRILARDFGCDLGVYLAPLHALDRSRVSCSEAGSTQIRVPAGFRYDGASLPFFALPLLGAKERWECAGLLHDALYRWQAPRAAADEVFWLVARSGGQHVGPVRGWLGWAGLRVGGWAAYRARGRER